MANSVKWSHHAIQRGPSPHSTEAGILPSSESPSVTVHQCLCPNGHSLLPIHFYSNHCPLISIQGHGSCLSHTATDHCCTHGHFIVEYIEQQWRMQIWDATFLFRLHIIVFLLVCYCLFVVYHAVETVDAAECCAPLWILCITMQAQHYILMCKVV